MIKKLYLIFILSLSFLAVGFATDTYINGCGTYTLASNTNYYLNFTSYTTGNPQCILLSGTTNAKISNVQVLGYQNKLVKQLGSSSNQWFIQLKNTFTGYVNDEDYFFENVQIKNINYEGSAPFSERNIFIFFDVTDGDRQTLRLNNIKMSNVTINQKGSSFTYFPIYLGTSTSTLDTEALQFYQKDFYEFNNINISNNNFFGVEELFYTIDSNNVAMKMKVLNNIIIRNNVIRSDNYNAGTRFFQTLHLGQNTLYYNNISIQENTILNYNNVSTILEFGNNYCKYTLNPSGINNNECIGKTWIDANNINILANNFNFGLDNSITHITAPLNDSSVLVSGYSGSTNVNYYHKLENITSPVGCGIDFVKKSESTISSLSLISTSSVVAYNTLSTFTAINFLNNTKYLTKVACDTELNTFSDTILDNFNFNSKIEYSHTTEFLVLYNGVVEEGGGENIYGGGVNYIQNEFSDFNPDIVDSESPTNTVDNTISLFSVLLNGLYKIGLPILAFSLIIFLFLIVLNIIKMGVGK